MNQWLWCFAGAQELQDKKGDVFVLRMLLTEKANRSYLQGELN